MPYPTDLVESIHSDDLHIGEFRIRNKLEINLKKSSTKQFTFVMMNPSKADSLHSDNTIDNLLNISRDSIPVFNENNRFIGDIGKVIVVNLFPLYISNSSKLWEKLQLFRTTFGEYSYDRMIENNRSAILDAVQDANYVTVAWGETPTNMNDYVYTNEVFTVLNLLNHINKREIFVIKSSLHTNALAKNGCPRHPGKPGVRLQGLLKIEIDKYNQVKVL